jgi:hypothetical protein
MRLEARGLRLEGWEVSRPRVGEGRRRGQKSEVGGQREWER